MAVESAAQAAWRATRAELATLVEQLTPADAMAVLRHTIAACENGDLVIARILGHARAVVDQHGDRRQQCSDTARFFMINGLLRADMPGRRSANAAQRYRPRITGKQGSAANS